jgi:hypothetical protein
MNNLETSNEDQKPNVAERDPFGGEKLNPTYHASLPSRMLTKAP